MYQRSARLLINVVTTYNHNQRPASWVDPRDEAEAVHRQAAEAALALVNAEQGHADMELLDHPDHVFGGVRSVAPLQLANEVGTWSLEYLGPGFHVQLRIARRQRQARVDGWMSPAQPITIFLTSLLRRPIVLEAEVSDTGRFEFPSAPTGACRMSFALPTPGRPPATPPFWI